MANLARHGIRRAVLATADPRIEAELRDGADLGVELAYSYETEPLGSGLAVKQAAAGIGRPFFVCNGDVITDLDLSAMASRHFQSGAVLSIALAAVVDPTGYGVVALAEGDRIVRFVEKPPPAEAPSRWANAGTWLFQPEVLDHIPDERMDRSLEQLVFPSLIGEGYHVQGFPSAAYWMDVGTAERYLQLHSDLLEGRMATLLPPAEGPVLGEGCRLWPDVSLGGRVLLGRGCRLGALVQVRGPAVFGDGCSLRERARVEGSVLWANVRVGAGAVVRDSVLADGCWIGDEAVVEGAVLGSRARVRRGGRLGPGSRLAPEEVAG